jgi:transketolase
MLPEMAAPNFDPKNLRRHVLYMAKQGNSVHLGCAFSIVEILSVLYAKFLRFNPANAADDKRDYLILSKGHGAMAMYACMRELDWVKQEDLDRYFADGSRLHGLIEDHLPGMEVTSGSLGHGMPIAVGIALGLKYRGEMDRKVYCIVGDGEINEGSIWEAALFAQHHGLHNLVVIVDANGFQAMGDTKSVLDMEPIADKFRAFGFDASDVDGHDVGALDATLKRLMPGERPKAIVARTVKGKGISFMENDNRWHYLRLDPELYEKAQRELR